MTNFSEEAYREKLELTYTSFPSVQKVPFGEAYKPGLERMEAFAALLGDPHKKIRTIHIAGTNGKGSVANMLASVLSASGMKVGLYTSPHILDFRERMRILDAGAPGPARLVEKEYVYGFLCDRMEEMQGLGLSFFEMSTGLAFRWFADEKVDIAVIEVGLGGRLDSTNIITPELSVVVSIGLDHCAILGNTLEEVAGEKAGIFKEGAEALVGEYLPQTRPVFGKKAENFCPLTFAQDIEPAMWNRKDEILSRMDLCGKYQEKNLRTVLAAIGILRDRCSFEGLDDQEKIIDAISRTAARMDFHGRWERLCEDPVMIADIGHNPAALKENFGQIRSMLDSGEYSSLTIVYAVMADKDLDGILPFFPDGANCIFTTPETSRALPAEDIEARFLDFFRREGRAAGTVSSASCTKEAMEMAAAYSKKPEAGKKPLVYIGGSTFLVAEAIENLNNKNGQR